MPFPQYECRRMASSRILLLPYVHGIRAVPHRKRNEQEFLVRGNLPVSLIQVTGHEAPVAVVVENDGWKAEYRSWHGRMYVPLGEGIDVGALQDGVTGIRPVPRWNPHDYPIAVGERHGRSILALPDMQAIRDMGMRVRWDDAAARAPEAQEKLSRDLLVVDGQVWTAASAWEPHWEVVDGRDGVEISLSLKWQPLAYVHAFRLDRLDAAESFAALLAARRGVGPHSRCRAAAEVLIPSCLRLDHVGLIAGQVASSLTVRVSNLREVESWPDHAYELNDRLHEAGPRSRATPPEAVEAYAILAAGAELADLLHCNDGCYARDYVERSRGALERWREREMACRDDLHLWPDPDGALEVDNAAMAGL